jgi:hypothetical protein
MAATPPLPKVPGNLFHEAGARLVLVMATAVIGVTLCAARVQAGYAWGVRIGSSRSYLEGALGRTYPRSTPSGTIGLSWRGWTGPWRLRAGISAVTRAGHGHLVPETIGTFDSNGTYSERIVTYDENWTTSWVEFPFVVERAARHGRLRPYLSVGTGAAMRFPLSENRLLTPTSSRLSSSDAHIADWIGSAAAGVEFKPAHGTVRIEITFSHGLGSLYDTSRGPPGSWRSLGIVLDANP